MKLCVGGDLPGIKGFDAELCRVLGADWHQHPAYGQCQETLETLLLGLHERIGADGESHGVGRARIESALLLEAIRPADAVWAAALAAVAGDLNPLARLASAKERLLTAAVTVAALGKTLWPGPAFLDELETLERTLAARNSPPGPDTTPTPISPRHARPGGQPA